MKKRSLSKRAGKEGAGHAERGGLEGGSWACIQGMGVIHTKKGRAILVVQEFHVFTQRDARELAREWKTKFVPHRSRLVKNQPTFDGRVVGETAEQEKALLGKKRKR